MVRDFEDVAFHNPADAIQIRAAAALDFVNVFGVLTEGEKYPCSGQYGQPRERN